MGCDWGQGLRAVSDLGLARPSARCTFPARLPSGSTPYGPHPSPATRGPAREPTLAANPGRRPLSLGSRPFGQRLLLELQLFPPSFVRDKAVQTFLCT